MSENDDQSIFKNEQPVADQPSGQNPEAPSDPYADKLRTITDAEGRVKYASVDAALDALPHANKHISTLEADLQEANRKMMELQQTVARNEGALEAFQRLDPTVEREQAPLAEPQQSNGMSQEDVVQVVTRSLEQQRAKEIADANVAEVTRALAQAFGDKAAATFYEKGAELGLPKQEMNRLAATSPKAVMTMFNIEQAPVPRIPSSDVIPNNAPAPKRDGPLPPPEQSVMHYATSDEIIQEWRRHGENLRNSQ